jgi:hypothetical protein
LRSACGGEAVGELATLQDGRLLQRRRGVTLLLLHRLHRGAEALAGLPGDEAARDVVGRRVVGLDGPFRRLRVRGVEHAMGCAQPRHQRLLRPPRRLQRLAILRGHRVLEALLEALELRGERRPALQLRHQPPLQRGQLAGLQLPEEAAGHGHADQRQRGRAHEDHQLCAEGELHGVANER